MEIRTKVERLITANEDLNNTLLDFTILLKVQGDNMYLIISSFKLLLDSEASARVQDSQLQVGGSNSDDVVSLLQGKGFSFDRSLININALFF